MSRREIMPESETECLSVGESKDVTATVSYSLPATYCWNNLKNLLILLNSKCLKWNCVSNEKRENKNWPSRCQHQKLMLEWDFVHDWVKEYIANFQ